SETTVDGISTQDTTTNSPLSDAFPFAYGFGGRESIRERRVRGGVLCRNAVHGCFGLRGDAALNGKLYVSARFVSGIWLNTREDLDKSERTGAVVTAIVRGQVGDCLRVDAG